MLPSKLTKSVKTEIRKNLLECRQSTLRVFSQIDGVTFCRQAHPDFSPVGWHFGHIAFTEAYWILEHLGGLPKLWPEYQQLFAADGLPKSQRQQLPSLEIIYDYLKITRQKVLDYLQQQKEITQQERLWHFLIQHESQHSETIAIVLHLLGYRQELQQISSTPTPAPTPTMIAIPAGEFILGNNQIIAQDNERDAHQVYLDTYYIDKYPVTCGEYQKFILDGGYQNPQWWTPQGWQWVCDHKITQPLYWEKQSQLTNHPVYGVSWYEAQAYAKFVGKRLPTEAEWEKAACWNETAKEKYSYPWGNTPPTNDQCNHHLYLNSTTPVNAYPSGKSSYGCYDCLGNVWEWTASYLTPYPSFQYYPYSGYSQAYFDHQHYVLKGGSWATLRWGLRGSFRNWYQPQVREIFAGFRCVT